MAAVTSPPLEHALRHLAWLVREDAHAVTDRWAAALRSYLSQPFRQLDVLDPDVARGACP